MVIGEKHFIKLLEQPFGIWLVGIVGAIIIGYGVYELYSGIKEKFMSEFKTYEMNGMERNVARITGKIGLDFKRDCYKYDWIFLYPHSIHK